VLDIPRNRPEDEAAEALCDRIIDTLGKVSVFDDLMPEQQELLCDAVYKLCGEAYHDGYLEGRADENRAWPSRSPRRLVPVLSRRSFTEAQITLAGLHLPEARGERCYGSASRELSDRSGLGANGSPKRPLSGRKRCH
jgi:hypothetical protein